MKMSINFIVIFHNQMLDYFKYGFNNSIFNSSIYEVNLTNKVNFTTNILGF